MSANTGPTPECLDGGRRPIPSIRPGGLCPEARSALFREEGPKIFVVSPPLFVGSLKSGVIDGEIWGLADRFRREGFDVHACDGYLVKRDPFAFVHDGLALGRANIVVVHLWKVEIQGEELAQVMRGIAELKEGLAPVSVVAFGYMAARTAATGELPAWIDATVTASDWAMRPAATLALEPALRVVRSHLDATQATASSTSMLCERAADLPAEAVISLHASRGCRSRCTFCAYNADLQPGWAPRDVEAVVDEIEEVLSRTPHRRIAFFDNDFAGSAEILDRRSAQIHAAMERRSLLGLAHIAINVRSDCLTPHNLALLRGIGVRTMLVGLESFNENTRTRVFGKRLDVPHLLDMLKIADHLGMETLLSYILWHPWQTLDGLRNEIATMIEIGRYRVPQFLSRSLLRVVPGTAIEKMLARQCLLRTGEGERGFEMLHRDAEALLDHHAHWLDARLTDLARVDDGSPIHHRLAMLKIQELDLYQDALGLSVRA